MPLSRVFNRWYTRTPRGTPAVDKGYAGKKYSEIFVDKTDNTNTFLLLSRFEYVIPVVPKL